MMKTMPHNVYTELTLSEIGLNYSRLRIIDPKTDAIIAQSLGKHGQIMPIIVGKTPDNKFEMIDGFKRFRACKQLGYEKIQAKVMEGKSRVFKAAIISLNTESRSIADFEKGL
ncbi:MAG: ParB N-terminal domain-containing protein, partial [Bacteroidetes bacterium]|nr:ParB N-terminal domain-containing protein [Bacteroidota bacterium]